MYVAFAQHSRFIFTPLYLKQENCSWFFLFAAFVGHGFGFSNKPGLVWYVLFMLFVPYAMLPLPLKWCMLAGIFSSVGHTICMIILGSINVSTR